MPKSCVIVALFFLLTQDFKHQKNHQYYGFVVSIIFFLRMARSSNILQDTIKFGNIIYSPMFDTHCHEHFEFLWFYLRAATALMRLILVSI